MERVQIYDFNHFNDAATATSSNSSTQHQSLLQNHGDFNSHSEIAKTSNFTSLQTIKRKKLQRQKSTEYLDEQDYNAQIRKEEYQEVFDEDLEAFEEETDLDKTLTNDCEISNKSKQSQADLRILPYQAKQLQFQQHKPQSESALLSKTTKQKTLASASHIPTFSSSLSCNAATMLELQQRQHQLQHRQLHLGDSFDSTHSMSPLSARHCFNFLQRDNSVQSDSSRYSSVDSLLEARKPDPEAILINLGFGPVDSEDILSRIPKRFLKPSQVRGIDTEAFVRRLQLASNLADHSTSGFRGLTGNPDLPPSSIVAKIMQRFEVNQRKKSMGSAEHALR